MSLAVLVAVTVGLAGPLGGCREKGGGHPVHGPSGGAARAGAQTAPASLGRIAYEVLRANLQRAPRAAEQLAVLEARREAVIAAIDAILPPEQSATLPASLASLIELVDDSTLLRTVEALAQTLELLAADPDGDALDALLSLRDRGAAPIDPALVMRLAARLAAQPELPRLLEATSGWLARHDGIDAAWQPDPTETDLLSPFAAALSDLLLSLERPPSRPGAGAPAPSSLAAVLVRAFPARPGPDTGAPAWVPQLDADGRAVLARRPDGSLPPPFIDRDRDGAPDRGPDGRPIDANGNPIALAPLGTGPGYDAEGRAVDAAGRPIYVYVDAKRTGLGQLLRLAGEIAGQPDTIALATALEAALVRERRTDPATGASVVVFSDDNPLHDLGWAALEILRYRDAPKVLQALAALIRHDEAKAERLLVKLRRVLEIVHNLPPVPAQPNANAPSLDDLVPLLDAAFEAGSTGGSSAVRLLLDAMTTEQRRLRNLPRGFARMLAYHDYHRRIPTAPPARTSILERLLAMMAEANRCDRWPFGNLADFYLDALAGNKRILGIPISAESIQLLMDVPLLRSLLCSAVSEQNVRALGEFARSGALDAMRPIAKAFSDAGRTSVLRRMLLALQPGYAQSIRPLEPALVQLLDSGAFELVFEILDDMNSVRVPQTGERVSDVVADFLAALVDDDRGVFDRHGRRVPSQLHLLFEPLQRVSQRIAAAGAGAVLGAASLRLVEIALATDRDDGGTPSDPRDDVERLRYPALVPLAAATLGEAADTLSVLPWRRNDQISRWQDTLERLWARPELPAMLDMARAFENAPERATILAALAALLRPQPDPDTDVCGALAQLGIAALARPVDPAATVALLRFGGRVLDPASARGVTLLRGGLRLLGGAQGALLTTVARNALATPPGGGASPLAVLLELREALARAALPPGQSAPPLTRARLRDQLVELVAWLRDHERGLAWVWDNVRSRRR